MKKKKVSIKLSNEDLWHLIESLDCRENCLMDLFHSLDSSSITYEIDLKCLRKTFFRNRLLRCRLYEFRKSKFGLFDYE